MAVDSDGFPEGSPRQRSANDRLPAAGQLRRRPGAGEGDGGAAAGAATGAAGGISLPLTGAATGTVAGIAAVLVVAGVALYVLMCRRKVKFIEGLWVSGPEPTDFEARIGNDE